VPLIAFYLCFALTYLQKLVKCATKKQLQTKICQKSYAKTPQKTHKNLGQKSFITKQKTYEQRFI